MLIQALCNYYDILTAKGEILPDEYSPVDVSYIISLTMDGQIDGIVDCRESITTKTAKGKEKTITKPKAIVMPRRTEKTCIDANIIEHRAPYIFGFFFDKKTGELVYADKKHEAFVKKNLSFFETLDDPICIAFTKFLKNWNPKDETENPHLLSIGKKFVGYSFAFCLSGRPDILLHENDNVKNKWMSMYSEMCSGDEQIAQCAIYGTNQPIARIHDKIKNMPGGSTMGCTLVGFNKSANESYTASQSYNSNISVVAMKHYTRALNYLLSNPKHCTKVQDFTLIHWAESENDKYDDVINMLVFGSKNNETDETLKTLAKGLSRGRVDIDGLDSSVMYYVVAIKPNNARLSVRFCNKQSVGSILENILKHQQDMKISNNSKQISLARIMKELIIPSSKKDNPSTPLAMNIMSAVLCGYKYPQALLETIIRRIRLDSDTDENHYIKMNDVRMGLIKAYINRYDRLNGREEEIKMSLDEQNTNPAYLCGRLFALLEDIQKKSAKGVKLNRTIKDAYFSSASARPATVFPIILKLAQYHMSKYDDSIYDSMRIAKIMGLMGAEFPTILSLKDQGVFMLGYYQQRQDTIQRIIEAKKNKEADVSKDVISDANNNNTNEN